MRKVLAMTGVLFLLVVSNVYSSDLYDVKKGPSIKLRDGVTAQDVAIPPAVGSGTDFSHYQYAIVDVTFEGLITDCVITPLFAASGAIVYASGQSVSATQNARYKVEVNGSSDFYVVINSLSGTVPKVWVYAQGVTE